MIVVRLKIKRKKPIQTPRTIIRCCIVMPSSMPKIILAGISIKSGMSSSFSRTLFAASFVPAPISPIFVDETLSFRSEAFSVIVSFAASVNEVRRRIAMSITNSFFMV